MALVDDPNRPAEPDENWVPVETFGTRLLLLRRHLGINQEEAATRCAINAKTWATWELGSRPRGMDEVVDAIHRALGVDREWLMWGSSRSR